MIGLIYFILSYMSVPHTIWKNKVIIESSVGIFVERFLWGFTLGWILIPWWLLTWLLTREKKSK